MTETTIKPSKTLEERLKPWIDQGEYLILLIVCVMAWTAGWVNLLSFERNNGIIFGRYTVTIFALLVAFTIGFFAWIYLIVSLRALNWLKRMVAAAQRTPIWFVLGWLVFAVVVWSMVRFGFWRRLPLMQGTVLVLFGVFNIVMLFAKPLPNTAMRTWQKVALGVLGGLIVLEIILQVLAAAGALPITQLSGLTLPYGRVYQTHEGFANGRTNQFGWYYPDFRLENGSRRIILNGDTFIEALQIAPNQHMGVTLEQLITAQPDASNTEVIAQGQLGYGAGQFLSWELSPYIWEPLQPNEIVVFFHLANDFQTSFDERGKLPRTVIDENGSAVVLAEDRQRWHRLAHIVISGHDPVNPIRSIFSHWLTYNIASDAIRSVLNLNRAPAYPDIPLNIEEATPDQPFGSATPIYAEPEGELAQQAYALAAAQIKTYADYMAERGIRVRLVTIPFFPEAFFTQNSGANWDAVIDGYDLSLPEQALREAAVANGIPFLGMLDTMQAADLTVEEIAALYFNDGAGHLTPTGHAFFAQMLYECFYSETADRTSTGGCVPEVAFGAPNHSVF